MNVYCFDEKGFFTRAEVAELDPVESERTGNTVWIDPANSTRVKPFAKPGKIARWNGAAWEYPEDHRGMTIYSAACRAGSAVAAIGPLPPGVVTEPPPSQYHLLADGKWLVDRDALIAAATARINAETDAAILSGFSFQKHPVKLSLENQMNYKSECDLRHAIEYPVKVKAEDGVFEIASPAEYLEFYTAARAYIRARLETGWNRKSALATSNEKQLLEVIHG